MPSAMRTSRTFPDSLGTNASSPSAAAWASLATRTGSPRAAVSCGPRATWSRPRWAARTTTPSVSTTPGVATPTPSSGRSVCSGQLAGDLDGRRGEALAGQLLPRTLAKAPTATGDDLARQVDDGPTNLAGAEVEADDVPGVGDDGHQRGRLADRAGQRPPGLLDHPLVDQLPDHVGHGGGGEPAGSGEVGTAHRTDVEQRTKQQRTVLPSRVSRYGLAPTLETGPSPRSCRTGPRGLPVPQRGTIHPTGLYIKWPYKLASVRIGSPVALGNVRR